ncbi:hypothetical protein BT93_C1256 [Corymbia citriodora subsp. variegata]|nr:hypothetical protein BT93_C1256 [Corymbia citriodora subsp. variegata]
MDSGKIRVRDQAAGSVLQGDKAFSERVLSRNSSVGHSFRFYYDRRPEGVPFQWEMQPGTPKNPPKEHDLPPLSPPPAVVSSGLPRPCVGCEDRTRERTSWSKLKFWKKIRIYRRSYDKGKAQTGPRDGKASVDSPGSGHDKVESFEFWSSDGDLVVSPRNSSASSLSTATLSFRNGANSVASLDHQPRSCTPWNFNELVVHFVKRI